MGEAKRRREKSPQSIGQAVEIKIEKSQLSGKWLVVAYILRQRYVISPFYQREDAEKASIEVKSVFKTVPYQQWQQLRRGDLSVLQKAMSLFTFDDDDEIIGAIDLSNNKIITKEEHPETIEQATTAVNQQAKLRTGKPLFKRS